MVMFTLSGHSELAVIARVHTLNSHLLPFPIFSDFDRDISTPSQLNNINHITKLINIS